MVDAAEIGRRLEQQIAAFFRVHGYEASCNQVLEGRSGGRHEIDVLAEKTDSLTTYRVAIECKAWQQPIEKDVISKLHYVRGDLGLHKGIVVSLSGWRSGAQTAADELGIELWGPAELRRHLGDPAVSSMEVPLPEVTAMLTAGYPFAITAEHAERQVRTAGRGWLQLRTVEKLRWFSPVWFPAYAIRLTVAQEVVRRLHTRLRSATLDNLYDAVSGVLLGGVPGRWEAVRIDPTQAVGPALRETKVHALLRKAVQDYRRVSAPAAVDRHETKLDELGIPWPVSSMSIDDTALVHLPLYVGILETGDGQRAVAIDGRTGQVADTLSHVLTANLARLRAQFAW
jgi:hypothetical protein